MALTTVENFKLHKGISGSADNSLYAQLLAQSDRLIKNYLQREIEQATYTEYPTSFGTRYLALDQWPISAITSVNVDRDRTFGASTLLTANTDYKLIDGRLVRLGGATWPFAVDRSVGRLSTLAAPAEGVVQVVYTAGYPPGSIPADLNLACIQLMVLLLNSRKRGVIIGSESLRDYSWSGVGLNGNFLDPIKPILAPHRRIRV